MTNKSQTVSAFLGDNLLGSDSRESLTSLLEERYPSDLGSILVFDDETGKLADLDFWDAAKTAPPPTSGRPRLGVKAREVTLLPRHWDWLASEPGGASATLRRLVDAAIDASPKSRQRRNAIYNFMSNLCGDRPGFEEATRALYRDDVEAFASIIAAWPEDIRHYLDRLAGNTAPVESTAI